MIIETLCFYCRATITVIEVGSVWCPSCGRYLFTHDGKGNKITSDIVWETFDEGDAK